MVKTRLKSLYGRPIVESAVSSHENTGEMCMNPMLSWYDIKFA